MMHAVEFRVRGLPAPQGSKAMMRHRTTGAMIMIESAKGVAPWRMAVAAAAMAAVAGRGWMPLGGPVVLRVRFALPRPKSHYRCADPARDLKGSSPLAPVSPPDLSKLLRATEDALTTARIWADDSLVVEVIASKVYAGEDPSGVLDSPGALIAVAPASPAYHHRRAAPAREGNTP